MSTRRLTIVLMTAAIAATGASLLPIWPQSTAAVARSRYTPQEGDFSVSFPVEPVVDGRRAVNDDDSSFRTYVAADEGGAFAVRVDQFPQSIRAPALDKRTYELLLRNHALETSSRLLSITPARLGGRAVLQGVFANKTGSEEHMRVLMVGRRVYQVSYTSAGGPAFAEAGAAFLESFRSAGR